MDGQEFVAKNIFRENKDMNERETEVWAELHVCFGGPVDGTNMWSITHSKLNETSCLQMSRSILGSCPEEG